MSDTVQLFSDAWKVMVGRLPSARIEDADGVATRFGNVPLIFLNVSIVERPAASLEELRALLKIAAGRAGVCDHACGVILREDWMPKGWEDVLTESGLAVMMPLTGMEAGELLPSRRPLAHLEIRRVENDGMARELAELNAAAYQIPVEGFECICNMHLWQPDSFGYVGYAGGVPVSCAAVFPVAGSVYVALVATKPGAQGKGYAETVMRHAVTQGQQAMGTTRTTLHATDMGFPVYRAMGYMPGPRLVFVGAPH